MLMSRIINLYFQFMKDFGFVFLNKVLILCPVDIYYICTLILIFIMYVVQLS